MDLLPQTLYHYTSEQKALQIRSSGLLAPSAPWLYLSVNLRGVFDSELPTGDPGEGWVSGRSEVPNIFLTDLPTDMVLAAPQGIVAAEEYVVSVPVKRIHAQGLSVFKNPSKEYDHIYNVPVDEGLEGLCVEESWISRWR